MLYNPYAQYNQGAPNQQYPPQQGWNSPSTQRYNEEWRPMESPHPSRPANVLFRWSTPNSGILNSSVRDPHGRDAFTVQTPKNKETFIYDANGALVAELGWHSTPTMKLRGGASMNISEWLPASGSGARAFSHNGTTYDLIDRDNSVFVYVRGQPYYVAILSDPSDMTQLDVTPAGMPLLQELVVMTVIFQSGHEIETSASGKHSASKWGLFGAIGGTAGAVFS